MTHKRGFFIDIDLDILALENSIGMATTRAMFGGSLNLIVCYDGRHECRETVFEPLALNV